MNLLLAAVGSGQTMGLVGTAAILIFHAADHRLYVRHRHPGLLSAEGCRIAGPGDDPQRGFFYGRALVLLAGLCILFDSGPCR
jgi:hypothetical protein